MRIEVAANDDVVSARIRAYAEYRLFSTLARHAGVIRTVWVILGSSDHQAGGPFTCEVDVSLQASGSARVVAQGSHMHAAIDSAAKLIGHVIDRLESSNGDSV